MFAALIEADLRIPGVRSLKEKRSVVKSLSSRLRNDLHCSVAEVDHQGSYQRAGLGVACAASTASGAERLAEQVDRAVRDELRVEVITLETRITTAGD